MVFDPTLAVWDKESIVVHRNGKIVFSAKNNIHFCEAGCGKLAVRKHGKTGLLQA